MRYAWWLSWGAIVAAGGGEPLERGDVSGFSPEAGPCLTGESHLEVGLGEGEWSVLLSGDVVPLQEDEDGYYIVGGVTFYNMPEAPDLVLYATLEGREEGYADAAFDTVPVPIDGCRSRALGLRLDVDVAFLTDGAPERLETSAAFFSAVSFNGYGQPEVSTVEVFLDAP